MYNRYIPQSDGTYRRNRIPDNPPRQTAHIISKPTVCPPAQPEAPSCPPPPEPKLPPRQARPQPRKRDRDNSAAGFLKQILPQNFDTTDLMVVLLLLLMSGDGGEDQNYALLTLALYLFL